MIVEASAPDVVSTDWSLESSIAEPYTPSQFDAPVIERSPVACGSLQFSDSFSLSYLYRHSTLDFYPEGHVNDLVLMAESRRRLSAITTPAVPASSSTSPASVTVASAAITHDDNDSDEALVRMSIKSLDVGEEPVFELPSGWKEAFGTEKETIVSRPGHDPMVSFSPTSSLHSSPLSKAKSTKKTPDSHSKVGSSVLPKLKSLWKRAANKFASR
jgi:hypothetical protein